MAFWPTAARVAHFGLDFTGPNGGVIRIEDLVIEDVALSPELEQAIVASTLVKRIAEPDEIVRKRDKQLHKGIHYHQCPIGRVDIDADTIPAETSLVDVCVSFTKGCYPGQELVELVEFPEPVPTADQY